MTQSEKYEQYAREAQEQVSHASDDADKAAWLWIAQSWLNLLGRTNPVPEVLARTPTRSKPDSKSVSIPLKAF
jgi:hypothetical protein